MNCLPELAWAPKFRLQSTHIQTTMVSLVLHIQVLMVSLISHIQVHACLANPSKLQTTDLTLGWLKLGQVRP